MFGAFNTFGRLGAAAGSKSLAQQIAAMSPSLWLEPSVTSGYQDSAGTTALTQPGAGAADPPVGLALDLSGLGNHATQSTSTARPLLSARRNLLQYTEDYTNGYWLNSAATVTPNYGTAPDGTQTSTRLVFPGANNAILKVNILAANVPSTASCWVKGPVGETLQFDASLGAGNLVTLTGAWQRATCPHAAGQSFVIGTYGGATARDVEVWHPQFELGLDATTYQRVTDANTYDYTGWPLIHKFDGVDDVLNVTFPSSLGSDCTVVTANQGATPTILSGQTIDTAYTITATNAGRLVFPRALTAAETAIVTKWATQKGALPS